MAMGLGLVFWMFLLFSPLAWVGHANADDSENYGTVIGIVSLPCASTACQLGATIASPKPLTLLAYRIWEQHTLVWV